MSMLTQLLIRLWMQHRLFSVWLGVAGLWLLLAILAPLLAPHDPYATDFTRVLQPPDKQYPFGTDQLGRCVLSRVLYGARTSLLMTFVLVTVVAAIGMTVGILAGYAGKWLDTVLMRLADTLMAFPGIIFAIAVAGMLGPGLLHTVVALAVVWWAKYARMVRSMVLQHKQKEYVTAAALGGARPARILLRYILPNVLPPLVVMAMMDIGGMLLSIAGLSFLGLGAQPPEPEWGALLSEGRRYMQTAAWLLMYPGLAIFCTVMIFNLLGDSLRDVLDPRHRR
ncbi:nickel transporter permease [Paenibacillus massiliensis]|uniref:nickel transporter permease n=1 Tax=Paenibacillus massiliensis TaxID=225917 RepID=UPI00041CF59C|nr:nickel transporter permease [Paenibacillus massiliensis]